MPSAYNGGAGSLFYAGSTNELVRFGALTATPYEWLEASYFYNYQRDRLWGTKLGFLDKGFNVKFSLKNPTQYSFIPDIAMGLIDFAGTGFYTSEYIVGSYRNHIGSFSLGAGFGRLNGGSNSYSNPLGKIYDHFKIRRDVDYGVGGSPSFRSWFTGDFSIFWGLQYNVPFANGMKLVIENDTFNYGFEEFKDHKAYVYPQRRKKISDINYGISFQITENSSFMISFVRGQAINLNFSFGGNFSKPFFPKKDPRYTNTQKKKYDSDLEFYEDVLKRSNQKGLFVQSAEIDGKTLKVAISQSKHRNMLNLSKEIINTLPKSSSPQIEALEVTSINADVEINKIKIDLKDIDLKTYNHESLLKRELDFASGNGTDYLENVFLPKLNLPQISHAFGPSLINHLGSPEQFYFGGVVAKLSSSILFNRNLSLQSELGFGVADNFGDKVSSPGSDLPHVRTEVVRYLQEGSKFHISRMQANYISSPRSEIFYKFSAGILEQMFNGYGFEVLYRPFKSNVSVGFDVYKVFKRTYEQRFKIFDNWRQYETLTGHLNIYHYFAPLQLTTHLSFGKYLAKDKGYTLDVSRKFRSGFKVGAFFTRTNVSAKLFGEGSFDKGIYLQIPLELFTTDRHMDNLNFKLRPLTRDGGQKLNAGSELYGITDNSQYYEFY